MKWILNALFSLGLILLLGLEFYPPLGNALHPENPPIKLEGQYSEETINTFLDHGFGAENNRNGSVARKWEKDIRVKIYGAPDAGDRQFLKAKIELLDTLTGPTRISLLDDDQENANMHIHIIPRKQFAEILPQYRSSQSRPTFFWCNWDNWSGSSAIYKSTILVDQDLPTDIKHNQLLRLLVRNIGLTELSLKKEQSVFTETTRTDYSPLDKSLVQLLYEKNFLCGTYEKQAREQLAKAVANALPKENETSPDEKQ